MGFIRRNEYQSYSKALFERNVWHVAGDRLDVFKRKKSLTFNRKFVEVYCRALRAAGKERKLCGVFGSS